LLQKIIVDPHTNFTNSGFNNGAVSSTANPRTWFQGAEKR